MRKVVCYNLALVLIWSVMLILMFIFKGKGFLVPARMLLCIAAVAFLVLMTREEKRSGNVRWMTKVLWGLTGMDLVCIVGVIMGASFPGWRLW